MNRKYENKILLVDDDSKNLQVAMSILKDYNVIFAQSGEKALELLSKNKFDLILLDVVMPTMDGYEVCVNIKNNPLLRNIPIIFLTVKDEEKDIVKGFELGAVDYVTKPFYSEVLLKRVQLHLNLSNVMKELSQVNINLNDIVKKQVEELRLKDKIIIQQSKIAAMADILDIISLQWKQPLDKVKLYLQSLSIKLDNLNDEEAQKIFLNTLREVAILDDVMDDFHKFFNNKKNKENTNIKVALDNAISPLKDELKSQNIKIDINGNNLICMNIVYEEIKHIFSKLLQFSLINFKYNIKSDNYINLTIEENHDSIYITYEDNSKIYEDDKINRLFDIPLNIQNHTFDLGFYLIKVFVEKNFGLLLVKKTEDGIRYIIRFDK